MPSVDFTNGRVPDGYKLPDPPIELVKGMSREEVMRWIDQELYKIYTSGDSYMIKEMKKEDLYEKLGQAKYDVWKMLGKD